MLDSVSIENFKCFRRQFIPLASLTLLSGVNASGKSSAIQAILLGSQLGKSKNLKNLALNSKLVKLGSSGDVLSHSSDDREIRFKYTSEDSSGAMILKASDRSRNSLPIKNTSSLKRSRPILNALKNIVYLSATRLGTLDIYPSPEESDPIFADVGRLGEFAPWWFNQYADELIDTKKAHPNEKALTMRRQFLAWANELFPGAEANTANLDQTTSIRLDFKMSNKEEWQRPSNIGYGLTYAFPILVAGLLAKKGQILIIDSPEAHLHPMGQSRIGYFLSVVAASGVQIIIETHSDHILNGIRLSVSQSKIPNEDVAIHFFTTKTHSDQKETFIRSPIVDQKGNLSEWPDGFFDQSDKDLAKLCGWEQ